ncbi:uncharacterized protein LOC108821163 isoform X2 [Raphanus sativus]|uniref:Uncharacterized protein LOC108821163 isoform X2 n=1 Tax=Raphanus sativus TaxID=3726 RepID=A0A9W3C0B6_RAPSA|nr:uncharacterized protein LOC108821163 isoform X2 [Raphanus sativus]
MGSKRCLVSPCLKGRKLLIRSSIFLRRVVKPPFVPEKKVLRQCSIWGNMLGSTGEKAMEAFMQAAGKLSAKKPAAKATTSGDDDVQILKSTKRKGPTSSAPSASRRRTRASGSTPMSSTPEPSLNPGMDLAKVVADLSSSKFPGSACFLPSGDLPKAFEGVQFDLLQVMF